MKNEPKPSFRMHMQGSFAGRTLCGSVRRKHVTCIPARTTCKHCSFILARQVAAALEIR